MRHVLPALGLLLATAVPGACGDDPKPPPPACLEQLCTPGSFSCAPGGNYVRQCSTDGEHWIYEPCAPLGQCIGGQCVARKCTTPGRSTCTQTDAGAPAIEVCSAQGQPTTSPCKSGEVCSGGVCVPDVCETGEVRCGSAAIVTCIAETWDATPCAKGEHCDEEGGVHCAAPACTPEKAVCAGGAAEVCDATGASATTKACATNEVCVDGFCQEKVCGVSYSPGAEPDGAEPDGADEDAGGGEPDASEADAGADAEPGPEPEPEPDGPPLEPIRSIRFTLNGSPNVFDLNARADYILVDKNLKLSAGKGNRKIEINFQPIEAFTVGTWSDTDFESTVTVDVCYFDGFSGEESPGCTIGFSHSSISYTATLETFNGQKGLPVVGKFVTELQDLAGNVITLTDGSFDVLQK